MNLEDNKLKAVSLINSINLAWGKDLQADERKWEPAAVYASMWHPCDRKIALDLVAWDQKPDFEIDRLEKMRRGKEREASIIARLIKVGQQSDPRFNVIHEQYSEKLQDRKGRTIIRMKIDGRFKFDTGEHPPFEIKSWSPNIADGIDTIADFDRSPWTKPATYQMACYLLAHNESWGVFVLETRGLPKLIPMFIEDHLNRGEAFLKSAERAMDAKEMWMVMGQDALPPFFDDPSVCRRCDHFGRACNPPLNFGDGALIITDAELETMLKRREDLAVIASEYQKIDKAVKERFQEIPLAIVGDFQITGEMKSKKGYQVKDSQYWQVIIEKLK